MTQTRFKALSKYRKKGRTHDFYLCPICKDRYRYFHSFASHLNRHRFDIDRRER